VSRLTRAERITFLLRRIMAAITGPVLPFISSQHFNEIVETLFSALCAAHCPAE